MRAVTVVVLVFEDVDCTWVTAIFDAVADRDWVLVIVDATTLALPVGATETGVRFRLGDVDVEGDGEGAVGAEEEVEEEVVEVVLEEDGVVDAVDVKVEVEVEEEVVGMEVEAEVEVNVEVEAEVGVGVEVEVEAKDVDEAIVEDVAAVETAEVTVWESEVAAGGN